MDRNRATEKQGEALTRILFALAAMAGLLDVARLSLPRHVYLAVLGPFRAAEALADRLPEHARDPSGVARLRLHLLLLCRVIGGLMRRLRTPARSTILDPICARQPRAESECRAGRAAAWPDTS